MTLLDWKSKTLVVAAEVKMILVADGFDDHGEEACRAWTRNFIRKYVRTWSPGDQLTPEQARLIGGAFERIAARARRQLRKH